MTIRFPADLLGGLVGPEDGLAQGDHVVHAAKPHPHGRAHAHHVGEGRDFCACQRASAGSVVT